MLAEYKKKTNIGIGFAIIIWVVLGFLAVFVSGTSEEAGSALEGISILPMFPFIYGLCCYAKGKGYHGAWGLLGLLTIIGLIILVTFPDKHKPVKQKPKDEQK